MQLQCGHQLAMSAEKQSMGSQMYQNVESEKSQFWHSDKWHKWWHTLVFIQYTLGVGDIHWPVYAGYSFVIVHYASGDKTTISPLTNKTSFPKIDGGSKREKCPIFSRLGPGTTTKLLQDISLF